MTKRELGSLAFKLAGIYVLVQAAVSVYSLGMLLTPSLQKQLRMTLDFKEAVVVSVLPTLALLILAVILLRYSVRLAEWTFPDSASLFTATLTAIDLQAALLTVLGVYFIASAVPGLVDRMASYLRTPGGVLLSFLAPGLPYSGTEILIGIALIVGRRGPASGWNTVRRAWSALRGRDVLPE